MKRFLFLVLASCLVVVAQAQKVYFMYLQSENYAPFFVRMADKLYSSTSTGYVILSSLKDSTYTFSVGFPGGKIAETRFGVTINESDRGFLIKNFDEGLALFDLQSLGVIKAMAVAGVPDNMQVIAKTDAFTRHLSEAAHDESLLYQTVALKKEESKNEVKKEPEEQPNGAVENKPEPKSEVVDNGSVKAGPEKPATETVKVGVSPVKESAEADTQVTAEPEQKEEKREALTVAPVKSGAPKDTTDSQPVSPVVVAAQSEQPSTEVKKDEPAAEYKRSVVTKRAESSTTEGFGLVFLDQQDDGVDTIRLLIPNPVKPFVAAEMAKEPEGQKLEEPVKKELQAKAEEVQKEEPAKEGDTGETAEASKKEERKTLKDFASDLFKAPKEPTREVNVENPSCSKLATQRDFIKVRKNMAAESNDEAMIDEAKVFFRTKCFTTEQIKNLSGLFLTSAAKYQFFDAAYQHITDPSQFPSLQSEIKDSYYLKRFKALIGE